MKIIEEKNVTLAEVKEILEEKEKKYVKDKKELLYEQKRALEHSRRYAKLGLKDVEGLKKRLVELGLNLTDEQIVKICDLLPEEVDDVRAIFAKDRFRYGKEDIDKILGLIAQYR
ncbi:MAG: DNA-directed RNA polymerase subunit F [Candidatus Altiarchaeota archaeon]|nr:DNA-directed RNA polymerase subunit F [Candidatus Altiarchaeota archaeon]